MVKFVLNILLTGCLIVLIGRTSLFAQLSPGDLHKSHARWEGLENCTKCHEVRKRVSSALCLNCHQLLAERIKAGKGLHSNPDYRECHTCHIEHQGRNFELIYWKNGLENFNHQKTGYLLKGKHQTLKCRQCHTAKNIVNPDQIRTAQKDPERTFLGLGTQCGDCHIDEHRGQFKNQTCDNCHSQQAWQPAAKFQHNRTRFPLTGNHNKVACNKCHQPIKDNKKQTLRPSYLKFRPVSHQKCSDCHKDPHQNKFGNTCHTCHTTSGWKEVKTGKFSHDLTRFPLKGKHQNVQCNLCHKNGINQPLPFAHCADCHFDEHAGQFASGRNSKICEDCHTVDGFIPSQYKISAHQKTDFPLTGGHLAIPCIACHTKRPIRSGKLTPVFRFPEKNCATCHKNPHDRDLLNLSFISGCHNCHVTDSWSSVRFDHGLTRFPLRGTHTVQACSRCHTKTAGKLVHFSGLQTRCKSCHTDPHAGQFADHRRLTDCSRCHVEKDWLAEKFDHNRDADFKIIGAHQQVPCASCHPTQMAGGKTVIRFKGTPKTCAECHASSPKKGEK